MKVSEGRRHEGPAGTAIEVLLIGAPANIDQSATVATWFLNCPGQSPSWNHYSLFVVHLRDIEGQSKSPVIHFPGATHEVGLIALNPDKQPTIDPDTWQHLTPINVCEQIQLPNDEKAKELLDLTAKAVVNGMLWAEPPLSGQREPWHTSMIKTSAHLRGEEHAP